MKFVEHLLNFAPYIVTISTTVFTWLTSRNINKHKEKTDYKAEQKEAIENYLANVKLFLARQTYDLHDTVQKCHFKLLSCIPKEYYDKVNKMTDKLDEILGMPSSTESVEYVRFHIELDNAKGMLEQLTKDLMGLIKKEESK